MAEQVVRYIDRRTLVGFFWGMSRKLALGLLMDDGSGRLFNTTARLNFGQEAELVDRMPSRGFTGWVSLSACQLITQSLNQLINLSDSNLSRDDWQPILSLKMASGGAHGHVRASLPWTNSRRLPKWPPRLRAVAAWAPRRPNLPHQWIQPKER